MVNLTQAASPVRLKVSLLLGLWIAMLAAFLLAPANQIVGYAAAAIISGLTAGYARSQVGLVGKRWVWLVVGIGVIWLVAIAVAVIARMAPGGATGVPV